MNMLVNHQSVVVGVDGSQASKRASAWAASIADRLRAPLVLAHAVSLPAHFYSDAAMPMPAKYVEQSQDIAREGAQRIVTQTIEALRAEHPVLAVSSMILEGPAVPALVELSGAARLVVLGSDGMGMLGSLLVGSVALGVANRALCPVIVLRNEIESDIPDGRRVVVGVDGSSHSELALAQAFEFASSLDVPLVAVHAWRADQITVDYPVSPPLQRSSVQEQQESVLLSECLAGWSEKFPDVEVTSIVERKDAAQALIEHSRDAQLLIVGSRGRNVVVGTMLGSTSQNLMHHAPCPLMICRNGK